MQRVLPYMWGIIVSLTPMEAIMTLFKNIKNDLALLDENETLIKLVIKFIPSNINSKYLHTERDLQTQHDDIIILCRANSLFNFIIHRRIGIPVKWMYM